MTSNIENRRVKFILPVKIIYPAFFLVNLIYGEMEVTLNKNFSTYDVQKVEVEGSVEGSVVLRGELMTDSRAAGCLVVLQHHSFFLDISRPVLKTGLNNTLFSTFSVPPGTYSLYVYDLEQNLLPYSLPAVILYITIPSGSVLAKRESKLLKNGNISKVENTILINCEFRDPSPSSSCVLVYRKYGSPLLTVIELASVFPVSITVDNTENYTFALFGKDSLVGTIDEEPVVTVRFTLSESTDIEVDRGNGKNATQNRETNISQTQLVTITTGTAVIGVVTGGTVVLLLLVLVRWYYNIRKKSSDVGTIGVVNRGVEYEEVDLPVNTTSSAIVTEPNTAYATTRVSTHV